MYTLKVKDVTKESSVETGERFLAVNFRILHDEKVVFKKSVAFPMDTPGDTIKEELQKHLETFKIEKARKKEQAIIDKEDKNADNIIEELKGQTL